MSDRDCAAMTARRLRASALALWIVAGGPLVCAPEGDSEWPDVAGFSASVWFPEARGAQATFTINGVDGGALYRVACRAGPFVQDPDFDYSGDFECRLTSLYSREPYSTLFTENPNQSRDWESRARFLIEELTVPCADYPEWGRLRTFRLRGMRIELAVEEVVAMSDSTLAPAADGTRLSSFRFTLTVDGDSSAQSEIAEPVPYDPPPYANPEDPDDLSRNCDVGEMRGGRDATGRVVRKDVNGSVSRRFLWSGANLLAELNSGGGHLSEYSYYPGLDRLHAVGMEGAVYFGDADGLGNVIELVTESNGTAATYRYDRWGHSESWQVWENGLPDGRTNRARYKGAMWMGDHGVELYYMRARWYEPQTGRFLSEDPIGLAGGVNPLVYASNNPVSLRDPTGLVGECGGLEPDAVECKGQGVVWGGSASLYYLSGEWGYVDWFHGISQWMKQCNVSGSPAFCASIRRAIDWLMQREWTSEQLVCRWMSGRADDRYRRGGYYYAKERDAGERGYGGWGTSLDFEDVHAGRMRARDARVLIIGNPSEIILRGTIIHEEAHYLSPDRGQGPGTADFCAPYY